jgi:phage-related protein
MAVIAFYFRVWEDVDGSPSGLRGACKANLLRLATAQPGAPTGLRLEKVHPEITELKISWSKQEFRLLFYREGGMIFVVNFFQKKTRKCPPSEINLAVRRMKEIQFDRTKIISPSLH